VRVLFVAVGLLVAGCGAHKSGNIRVRIGNAGNGLQTWCLPIMLAHSLGYYKEEGLDVSLENLPSGAKSLQALVGGSVDVAGFLYERNLEMAAEGQHVRSFFIMTRRDGRVLIVAPKANERVRRAEDLKGGLIGVSTFGAGNHQLANYYLAAHGVRPSEVGASPSA
jgi:NitT/TauT family transport system substrate-binding protein